MKSVQFTVTFTGEVPDVDVDTLFLELDLPSVRVGRFVSGESITLMAKLHEYETVNVEELEG
jgi:hypothetical protein